MVHNSFPNHEPDRYGTMGEEMKSFWLGTIAAIIIAIVAGVALDSANTTSGQQYSTANTRL